MGCARATWGAHRWAGRARSSRGLGCWAESPGSGAELLAQRAPAWGVEWASAAISARGAHTVFSGGLSGRFSLRGQYCF